MKIIQPYNRPVYELEDLDEEVQRRVMYEHIDMWLETRTYRRRHKGNYEKAVDEAERMGTPWLTPEYVYKYCKKEIIREIKANKTLFTKEGVILPIVYHEEDGKTQAKLDIVGEYVDIEIKPYKIKG